MNFNFFKKKETVNPQASSSQEKFPDNETLNTINPEKDAAVQGLEKEIQDIASLSQSDLIENISDPEKREQLANKLELLAKVGETLKDYWPSIVTGLLALTSLVIAIRADNEGGDLANSAVMSAQKLGSMIGSAVATLGGLISIGLASWKNTFKEYPQIEK